MSRAALLVGIDDYPVTPLQGCAADARRVEKLLATHADGNPNFETDLLVSPGEAVDKAVLRQRLEALLQAEAEVALFYFSGHGSRDLLGGYLVTPDARQGDPGLPMEQVLVLANQSPVRQVVVVLDCCNSGAFGHVAAMGPGVHLRAGVSVLTASRESESALEVGGGGVFTSLLCSALDGGAADVLGNVTIASAYAYVDEALGVFEQRPLFRANVSRLSPLRQCLPEVPRAELRLLPELFRAADADLLLDPTYERTSPQPLPDNCRVMAMLQRMRPARLVQPVGTEHLYFAAMERKPVRLTPLGRHYWRLARDKRI